MVVLVTCKKDADPTKNQVTAFLPLKVYGDFSRRSRAANSTVPSWILLNFEPVRYFTVVLVNCKNDEDQKKLGARVLTRFLPL